MEQQVAASIFFMVLGFAAYMVGFFMGRKSRNAEIEVLASMIGVLSEREKIYEQRIKTLRGEGGVNGQRNR